MRAILSLFAKSPFEPMKAHMEKAHECAKRIEPLFAAVLSKDQEAVKKIADEISRLESEADEIKHDIRNHLPKSLFLPIDRRDLLEILHIQDAIADIAQAIEDSRATRLPGFGHVLRVREAGYCQEQRASRGRRRDIQSTRLSYPIAVRRSHLFSLGSHSFRSDPTMQEAN